MSACKGRGGHPNACGILVITTPALRAAPPTEGNEGKTTPALRATPPTEGNKGKTTPALRAAPPTEGE